MTFEEAYKMQKEAERAAAALARKVVKDAADEKVEIPLLVKHIINNYVFEREVAVEKEMSKEDW